MRRTTGTARVRVLGLASLILAGCATQVLAPPRIDLREYGTIGLIGFSGSVDRERGIQATERFLDAIHGAQPGVRILELGEESALLRAVDRETRDPESIRAIGKKYDVDAILIGRLDLGGVTPGGSVGRSLTSVSVRAYVEGSLHTRLYETRWGATLWTRSARHEEPVVHASLSSEGWPLDVGASTPEEAYEKLVDVLVTATTSDFRRQVERR